MGDASRDTAIPANTAIVPVPKLENDCYDWYARHAAVLRMKDEINPEIVLIGDSITHFWGGEPEGRPGQRPQGLGLGLRPLSRAESRFRLGPHAERPLAARPRRDSTACIRAPSSSTSARTTPARPSTPARTRRPRSSKGIAAICGRVRSKAPGVRIILMQVMPREEKPDNPRRAQIAEINRLLVEFAQANHLGSARPGPEAAQARRHAAEVVDAGLLSSQRRRLHDLGRRPETALRSGQERTERHALNETAQSQDVDAGNVQHARLILRRSVQPVGLPKQLAVAEHTENDRMGTAGICRIIRRRRHSVACMGEETRPPRGPPTTESHDPRQSAGQCPGRIDCADLPAQVRHACSYYGK